MDTVFLKKYEALPDELRKEVIDFIDFLYTKYQLRLTSSETLSQRRTALFGNAKGSITILPEFDTIPEGFEEYK